MSWFRLKDKANRKQRLIMYLVGFILAISVALPAFIQSNFISQFISLELVSLFFVLANSTTAVMIAIFPRLINRLGNYFSSKIVMIVYATALLGMAAANGPFSATLTLLLFIVSSNLLWINIDIILEEASIDNETGRIRSLFLTFMNLGWIIAPTISAYLVTIGEYPLPFLASALLVIPLFAVISRNKKNLKDKSKFKKEKILTSWKKLWKNKNLRGVFMSAIALNLFFSGAVIYIPIYLHQYLGMEWSQLGWIFSFMLVPFVLFEIPAGFLADKYFGEKEMLIIGLFIVFLSSILFSLIKVASPLVWAAVLFFSRIGAALVESMRDTYFFKKVSSKDIGFINIFRMTNPIGYATGTAFGALFLLFLPINYLFLVFAILLLPAFYFVAGIKDTK